MEKNTEELAPRLDLLRDIDIMDIDTEAVHTPAEFDPDKANVHFLFRPHAKVGDIKDLQDHVVHSDIIGIELFGWLYSRHDQPMSLNHLEKDPFQPGDDYIDREILSKARYSISQPEIFYMDVPDGHPMCETYERLLSTPFSDVLEVEDYDAALEFLNECFRELVDSEARRETYSVNLLLEVLSCRQQEKRGSSVNATILYGSAHTNLHHTVKQICPNTSRDFGGYGLPCNMSAWITRQQQLGNEARPEINRGALIEQMFFFMDVEFAHIIQENPEKTEQYRGYIMQIPEGDIRWFYDQLSISRHQGLNNDVIAFVDSHKKQLQKRLS